MKRRRIVLTLALLLLLSLFVSFPASATTIPTPDSGPYIISYDAYESVYVSGDILFLIEYNIPYATLPPVPASSSFVIQLLDPLSNVLGTTTPFSYQQLGYGYGVAALYFAPGTITWGDLDVIKLTGASSIWSAGTISNNTGAVAGSPVSLLNGVNTVNTTLAGTLFVTLPVGSTGTAASGSATLTDTPVTLATGGTTVLTTTSTGTLTITLSYTKPDTFVTMAAGDWNSAVSVIAGRSQVCQKILTIATALQDPWNTVLTAQAANSTVLNSYGRQYFSGVIPYCSTICGAIFLVTNVQPVYPPSTAGTLTNGTGTAVGSPLNLSTGTTSVAITGAGNFTVTLPADHTGTAVSDTATVTGSPVTLASGITTIAVTGVGLIKIIQSAYSETYGQSLMSIWPNATTTMPGGTVVGVGVSINDASTAMGMTTDQYIFMCFLVVISFVTAVTAAALGGAQFIPLLFLPVLVGCIKVGVVPMALGVGLCAIMFIISMFFLIHRRAPV